MKTAARRARWTSRLGAVVLTVALSALLVTGYQAALERTGRAVHAVLSSDAPAKASAPALAASQVEPTAAN